MIIVDCKVVLKFNKTNKTYFYICEIDDNGLIKKDSEYRISFDLVNSYLWRKL